MDTNLLTNTELIREVVAQSIETITFALVDPISNHEAIPEADMIHSYITVSIASSNIVVDLALPKEFLNEVITTLYPDIEITDTLICDTIDELCNTICGTFFRRLEPETGAFELTVPYRNVEGKLTKIIEHPLLLDDHHPIIITLSQPA